MYINVVMNEFDYVVKNGTKQKYWIIADANFGIFSRDLDIARVLKTIRDAYGFPLTLNVNWAKMSSAKLVIEIVKILNDMINPQIAVQSFDKGVLKEVNRINMGDSDIAKLIEMFHNEKRKVYTDILIGLSGETLQSHQDTLDRTFKLGFDR
jgi:tRNA A37 methylthiotransferase MiaB